MRIPLKFRWKNTEGGVSKVTLECTETEEKVLRAVLAPAIDCMIKRGTIQGESVPPEKKWKVEDPGCIGAFRASLQTMQYLKSWRTGKTLQDGSLEFILQYAYPGQNEIIDDFMTILKMAGGVRRLNCKFARIEPSPCGCRTIPVPPELTFIVTREKVRDIVKIVQAEFDKNFE